MRRVAFAVPGDLATPTGGYAYARHMIAELQSLGWTVDVVDLGEGFPWPDPRRRATALTRLRAIPESEIVVADGLAFGVLPDVAAQLRERHPLIALVHHPLALETGLLPKQAEILRNSETKALACAHHVIVTSPATVRQLCADYAVPADRITVVCPGTAPSPMAQGGDGKAVQLLSVGAVVPRKGFDVLVAALAQLADLPWHLHIAGDRTRDLETASKLDADIARHGLASRVTVTGAVPAERLEQLYAGTDAFVLASRYEGYGMAYAEAIAHGIPVIGTTAGAIPDTVPPQASMLIPPDDVSALVRALRDVIAVPDRRQRMAAAAREAAVRLPRWSDSAAIFSKALEAFA